MAKRRRQFTVSYCNDDIEVVWKFYSFSTLKKFINKIPEHELKNTSVIEKKNGYLYVGKYYKMKSGNLSIEF
jgi:hypothetical protein